MFAARNAEAAVASGAPLGKLHGVPITIKDLVRTKDMPMQSGSSAVLKRMLRRYTREGYLECEWSAPYWRRR